MRVTTAFNRMLGMVGTRVLAVRFDHDRFVVGVAPRGRRPMCPCGQLSRGVYDRRVRRWRHLDAGGARVELEAVLRRVDCRGCGRVRTEQVPWARPGARHTIAFESRVLWCARRMDKTAVADAMRIAWATVDAIIERAASDPATLARLDGLRRIGVDEIAYRRRHRFLTVVVNHDSGAVVWAADGKDAATLGRFYDQLGPQRCAQLEAVTMDLGLAYRRATETAAPQARLCADPFHLVKLANETLEAVRAKTHRHIKDPNLRWALLKRPDQLTERQRHLLDTLAADQTDTWRAWSHREHLCTVLHSPPSTAATALDHWFAAATSSTVIPIRNLARRFARYRDMILATIETGLSNARSEGNNSKIRLLNHRGYGHHRPGALIALILLCCTPQTTR